MSLLSQYHLDNWTDDDFKAHIPAVRSTLAALLKPELVWIKQKPAIPEKEGWYKVMYPGDSESIDGHTIYAFDDYETWAYWTPASPYEFEDFEGGYKGGWACSHDEDGESIFAYCGPIPVPPFKKEKT